MEWIIIVTLTNHAMFAWTSERLPGDGYTKPTITQARDYFDRHFTRMTGVDIANVDVYPADGYPYKIA